MIVLLFAIFFIGLIFMVGRNRFKDLYLLSNSQKIHLIILSVINLTMIIWLIDSVRVPNDKAMILLIFGYPLLTVLNALVWVILKIFRRPEQRIYKMTTISLIVLFFPILFLSTL